MTPRRVIGSFYAISGAFNLANSLIWGVNTLFLLDAGLTIFQTFAANAAYTAGMVIFEIPTGVVADTRGRRLSYLLAVATLFLGTLAYVVLANMGAHFGWWIAASLLLGLGFTFYSGAVEAWFVDALAAVDGPTDLDPYFARNSQVFSATMLIGTVGGGFLGQIDLGLPYIVRTIMLGILLVAGYILVRDIGFKVRPISWHQIPREIETIAKASWKHGLQNRPVRLLMLLSAFQMSFLMWGWYAYQPYFLELLGKNLIWVAGVISASVAIVMIIGNQVVRMLHGKVRRPTVMVVGSIVLAGATFGVGLAPNFASAVAFFLLAMLGFGVVGPVKQAAIHSMIPSAQRATIISFDGMLGSIGGVGSQLGLAKLAQDKGYAAGYLAGGFIVSLAVPFAIAFRKICPPSLAAPDAIAAAPAALPADSEE